MRVPAAAITFPAEDRAEILSQIDECLRTGQLTLGAIGRQLEGEFAAAHGAAHAISTNSGTSAIEIPLQAHGRRGQGGAGPGQHVLRHRRRRHRRRRQPPVRRLRSGHHEHGSRSRCANVDRAEHGRRRSSSTSVASSAPRSARSSRSATSTACSCSRTPPTPTAARSTAPWPARSVSPGRSPSTPPRSWPAARAA